MIQWIALAVALDANSTASDANAKADEANHVARGQSPLVIVRPVDLVYIPNGKPVWRLFGFIPMTPTKEVLAKEPWGIFSIKKSDILNITESKDEDGNKYCKLRISEYAKVRRDGREGYVVRIEIPGSIEEVASVIGAI